MKYLLVVVALLFVLYRAYKQVRRALQGLRGGAPWQAQPQVMVRCAYCGLHVPQHEAFYRAGQGYCSIAHAHSSSPVEQPTARDTVKP